MDDIHDRLLTYLPYLIVEEICNRLRFDRKLQVVLKLMLI